ncbi:MAG: hypothetical protein LBG15_08490 [Dysgonamonadaceae bacterium]|jgi:hypothetical protein|nr:hypothetical protein [Dysgonamonadaceae bacterium]
MKTICYIAGGLMLMAILSFALVSCNKEKTVEKLEEISVDQSELTFTQKDESKELNVSYTGEWHFEATGLEGYYGPNKADVKDFTIEPASGKENTKVTVTLKNDLTESYDVDLKVVTESSSVTVKLKAVAN